MIGTYGVGYATEHYARLLLLTGSDEEYRRLCQRLECAVRRNGRRGHGVLAGVDLHGWSAIGHRACENRTLGRTGGCRDACPDVSLCPRRRPLPGGPVRAGRRVPGRIQCAVWHPADASQSVSPRHGLPSARPTREKSGVLPHRDRGVAKSDAAARIRGPGRWQPWERWRPIRVDALELHAPRGQSTPRVDRRTGSANRERSPKRRAGEENCQGGPNDSPLQPLVEGRARSAP